MANLLDALMEMVKNDIFAVSGSSMRGGSVVNALGDDLEDYVLDIFSGTLNETNATLRQNKINEVFSYTGNSTTSPDSMLRGGDAIEVKKIKGNNQLQLNSSYPKQKLLSSDIHLCKKCKTCEDWDEKDMLYIVGILPDDVNIKSLFFVYGYACAAEAFMYEKIIKYMKKGIEEIDGPTFSETKELGRINQIDLRKRTSLRLRGMYLMDNPWVSFNIPAIDKEKEVVVYALIPTFKYNSFDNVQIFEDFCDTIPNMSIETIEVDDPTYVDKTIECKMIKYYK